MCINPSTLTNGQAVACRICWQCVERRILDWSGRCIAESKTSVASHSITLTYGRDEFGNEDHLRAKVLTYSDVQKYLKKLRFNGYPLRYLVAGEYGPEKGRTHWHLIAFWQDKVPPHTLKKNFNESHWDHGFSFWDDVGINSVRYCCKYLQKDRDKDEKQSHMSMSKIPPLGANYFDKLAQKYVDQGLAPQDLTYSFPDVRSPNTGKKYQFTMMNTSAKMFMQVYLAKWEARYPGVIHPYSEILQEYEDSLVPDDTEIRIPPRGYHIRYPRTDDLKRGMKMANIYYDEKLHVLCHAFDYNQTPWYWVFNEKGKPHWVNDIREAVPPSRWKTDD